MKNFVFKAITTLHDTVAPKKNVPSHPRRFLIVSTTGLGDSLWGTPAIRALKEKYPDAHLSLLTSPIGKAVFQNSSHLDDIFVLKNPALPSCLRLFFSLRKKRFDTTLIFHTSQRPVLPFVHLLRPQTVVGTASINKGLDHYLTDPIENTPIHEIQRRLNIAGIPDASPQMELFLTDKERQEATDFFEEQDLNSLTIGMHPGAKDKFKQWNPKHFISLGQKLAQKKHARILITGDESEIPLAKSIAKNIPGALCLAGKFSLRLTAALIEKMDHFITNDTGPMHLAFTVGTQTTALFAPTDPKLCGPYQIDHGQVIQKKPTCSPCMRKKCQVPFCMEQISPEEVFQQLP